MEQAQAQNLQDQIAQLINAVNALNARVEAQEAHRPGAGAVRFRLNFDTFSYEEKDPQAAFENFEQNVRVVTAAMRYPFPDVCNAVIGQFRGKAAQMVRDMVGNYGEFPDLNAFLARLRQIFVSPAYQEKARAAFYLRLQQKGETIVAYHGIMRSLWERAFPVDQRQEATLIRQFISGLYSQKVMEQLHLGNYATSQAALADAMRYEGMYEILEMNIKRRENHGQLEPNQQMLLTESSTITTSYSGGAEAMEIGNINPSKRGYQANRGYKGQGGRDGRGKFQDDGRGEQASTSRRDTDKVDKDQCITCKGFGHWAKQCPSPRRQEAKPSKGMSNGRSRGGNGRNSGQSHQHQNVNYISEDECDSDTDSKNE